MFPGGGRQPREPVAAAGAPPRTLYPQLLEERGPGTLDPLPHFCDWD